MNETTVTTVKAAIAAAVATMTALWGWFGWLVIAWVLLMLADWLIGSAAAAKEGRWSSAKMREGAWHKGGMILVVCIALVADWLIGSILGHIPAVSLPFDYSVLLAPLVIVWYIIGELGSLAEHAVTFGGAGALLAVQYFGNRQKRRRRRRGEHRRRERRRRFQGQRGIKRAASLGEGRRSVPDMEIEQKHVNKEGHTCILHH